MMRKASWLLVLLALPLAAPPSASARVHVEGGLVLPPVVVAPGAPPPLRREIVPAAPPGRAGPAIWAPGHWEWRGRGYVWIGGRYVVPPRPGLVWVPGRWTHRHHHWEWRGGHWRR